MSRSSDARPVLHLAACLLLAAMWTSSQLSVAASQQPPNPQNPADASGRRGGGARGRGGRGGQPIPDGLVAVGTKIADGQAYATIVHLQHQSNPADNGRILLAFEENGMAGIPLWESRDEGESWQFVREMTDGAHADLTRCNLHWQPHLTEMPRTMKGIAAGTVLLSASTVCNGDNGRLASEHLQLYTSTDAGRTWDYISTYAEGAAGQPVWEPHLLILDDGTFVEYYSSEVHKDDGYNQLLAHRVSTDGGKTWGPEVYDTAMKGGVERPGMVIIDRLPDKRYIYNFEDVAGPVPNQIYIKFSDDGLHWGDPEERGTPVQTESGAYPTNTPTVRWLPMGGPDGIILVAARASSGGGEPNGRSLYWNNNKGVGPWWEVPAPVQKLPNNRSGWTQAMMLRSDGRLLHITSSAPSDPPNTASRNSILFNAVTLNFNRYEAEDAAREGAELMLREYSMSNAAKVRLAPDDAGKLTFHVHLARDTSYRLAVGYSPVGATATPRLTADGTVLRGTTAPAPTGPANPGATGPGASMLLSATTRLTAGDHTIEIGGGGVPLDVDYLEVTPQ